MQLICKEADCKELYEKCADYASTQETPCFFESATGISFIIFLVLETIQVYFIRQIFRSLTFYIIF